MYLDPTSFPTWWDSEYAYRQQVTVTAGTTGVGTGYSVPLTFNHQALVAGGKADISGDDLRVVHYDGVTHTEIARSLDPFSIWDFTGTKIWFSLQDPISASGSDNNYYIYYGDSTPSAPPDDPANVFTIGDRFDNGTLTAELITSTAGSGTAVEDIGFSEAIATVPADVDAAIFGTESGLPLTKEFSIRHLTKLESSDWEVTLLGIIQQEFEPDVADSTIEDPRRRIMVTQDAGSGNVYASYFDGVDTQYWDGALNQWDPDWRSTTRLTQSSSTATGPSGGSN